MNTCATADCKETHDLRGYLGLEWRGNIGVGVTLWYCAKHDPGKDVQMVPIGWEEPVE